MVTPSAEGLGLKLEVVWNSSVLHYYSNAVLHDNASFGVVMIFVFWVNDDVISDTGVFVYDGISYTTVGPNADVRHFSRGAHAISYTSLPSLRRSLAWYRGLFLIAPITQRRACTRSYAPPANYILDLARD